MLLKSFLTRLIYGGLLFAVHSKWIQSLNLKPYSLLMPSIVEVFRGSYGHHGASNCSSRQPVYLH